MYCKYCGNNIEPSANRCMACGAEINMRDGGQTFYDEGELAEWVSAGNPVAVNANFPQTEERQMAPMSPISPSARQKRVQNNKKKAASKQLKVANSNKFITFCVVATLTIVLLAAAIVFVINEYKKPTEKQFEGGGDNSISGVQTDVGEIQTTTQVSDEYMKAQEDKKRAEEEAKRAEEERKRAEEQKKKSQNNTKSTKTQTKTSDASKGAKDSGTSANKKQESVKVIDEGSNTNTTVVKQEVTKTSDANGGVNVAKD